MLVQRPKQPRFPQVPIQQPPAPQVQPLMPLPPRELRPALRLPFRYNWAPWQSARLLALPLPLLDCLRCGALRILLPAPRSQRPSDPYARPHAGLLPVSTSVNCSPDSAMCSTLQCPFRFGSASPFGPAPVPRSRKTCSFSVPCWSLNVNQDNSDKPCYRKKEVRGKNKLRSEFFDP